MRTILKTAIMAICMLMIIGTASAAFTCDDWQYSDELPQGIDIDFDIECDNGMLSIVDNSSGILNPGIKTIQIWSNTSTATQVIDDDTAIKWSPKSPMTGPFKNEFADGVEFEIDQANKRSTGVSILFNDGKCPEEIALAIHIRWENENGEMMQGVLFANGCPVEEEELSSVWAFTRCTNGGSGINEIPEFPTVALPIAAILGLAFFFQRRKE
ncbi:MAG: PEF-CTERM sorting domain-containing protein [Methanolobus sp.]|uniref:PEF-CTERM sorting domain-containing protein n=1 Tax=Methanolobus sp. TaxID=1874737 RepID=UPI0027313414|nr:PEF-CTERM sorting domain-containing protein [Methanolobus sp.]MDP2217545.1 PEF-CTERM sorting domain-containing protein [Methanolobus sp.]